MELKKEDFIRIRTFEDRYAFALRPDFFDEPKCEVLPVTINGKTTEIELDKKTKKAFAKAREEVRIKAEKEAAAVKALEEAATLAKAIEEEKLRLQKEAEAKEAEKQVEIDKLKSTIAKLEKPEGD